MPKIINVLFPWDDHYKFRNNENRVGSALLIVFSYIYFIVFLILSLKLLIPFFSMSETAQFGHNSPLMLSMDTLISKWWVGLLSFGSLMIIYILSIFSEKIIKLEHFRSLFKIMQNYSKLTSLSSFIFNLTRDILIIAFIAFPLFVISELISFAVVVVILSIILPFVLVSANFVYATVIFMALLFHIGVYPFTQTLYLKLLTKQMKKSNKKSDDFSDYYTNGEINVNRWTEHTWAKKAYSYDWQNEEYEPFVCPQCGSIISSNLTVCPICNANIPDLINEILEEEKDEEKDEEKKADVFNEKMGHKENGDS